MRHKIGIFLCMFLILASPAWAAPGKPSLSGTLTDGQALMITGSGFGDSGPAIELFDDFELGANGNTIPVGAGSAQVGTWDIKGDGPANQSAYSNTYKNSGSLSWMQDWYCPYPQVCRNTEDGPRNSRELSFHSVAEIYVSWWVYIPEGKYMPGVSNPAKVNWKTFWLGQAVTKEAWPWGSDQWACFYYNEKIWTAGFADDISPPPRISFYNDGYRPSLSKGQWSRWEYYFLNSPTSSGRIAVWDMNATHPRYQLCSKNGVTAHAGELWNRISFAAFGRPEPTTLGAEHSSQTYYDDIYFAVGPGCRARVEIGNRPSYNSCTNLAVFTPTAWNDTKIMATVRQGSFTAGQTVYLFVVDANGVVNTESSQAYVIGQTYR